jgi:DNA invertase Pin-like site-specific DNA recombinase
MERKSIIYARVSTQVQDTDRQVADLQSYAQANGYVVEKIITEQVSGAKRNEERPALLEALDYATANGCTILCSELSRLGRNIDEVLKAVINCKEHRINVYFQKEQLSIFTPDGNEHPFLMIMIATLSTCAAIEREGIVFRLKSGYNNYRLKGGKVGRKEGYRVTMKDYEVKYPALVKDLRDKANGAKGSLYSVRALADRHHVNASTVQAVTKLLK